MAEGMQMVNCGSCRLCLAVGGAGGVHGPYPHHFESLGGGKKVHRYGSGSSVPGGTGLGGSPRRVLLNALWR